jgi:acetoin utilization deacetylase AcuC-like enzyme
VTLPSNIPIAYSDAFVLPLPPGHRFPMAKYAELPRRLLGAGLVKPEWFFSNPPMKAERVLRVHTADYVQRLQQQLLTRQEVRKIGFPLSSALVKREFMLAEATWQCALRALSSGLSFNIAGGTHHAFSDHGEGFCLLNDIAIAAANLRHEQKAKRILIVDLDVHQGNGTAEIFKNTPEVFTFSMHGAKNYPVQKQQSDLDIALPPDTDDNAYLEQLQQHLPTILNDFAPDFVFYLAGVDVLASDKLGKLQLTLKGCQDRDDWVYQQLRARQLPVVTVMGGGYSPELNTVVTAHMNTFRSGLSIYA